MIAEVITTLAAHGTITASRTSRRPGNAWWSSCASASEITIVTATTPTTQTTVFSRIRSRLCRSSRLR